MNTDNEIRDLFKGYNPTLSDDDAFMERLGRKLDAVEDAKLYHREAVKSYWTGSIIAFIVGAAVGAFILFLVVFRPESLTELRLFFEGVLLRCFAFWKVFLILAVIFVATLIAVPMLRSRRHSLLGSN